MRWIVGLLAAVVLGPAVPVSAQSKTYEPHNTEAILKIQFQGDENLLSSGSCVVVDEYHVLTAAHVVGASTADISTSSGPVRAKLVAIDFFHDRALLRSVAAITKKARSFRDTPLSDGEPLFAIGFGGRGFGFTRCQAAAGAQIKGRAIEGDSGGPVCDQQGRIVGLIKGYSPQDGLLMSPGRKTLAQWTRDNMANDPLSVGP